MQVKKYLPDNAIIDYIDDFLSKEEANSLFEKLMKEVPWKQEQFGKYPQPRLTAWYAEPGMNYTYSGVTHSPLEFSEDLLFLKNKIEESIRYFNSNFEGYNSVLLNQYRNGKDSVGYHADDEKELGENPNIASISLGATRKFIIQQYKTPSGKLPDHEPIEYDLTNGSLLIMSGTLQKYWKHSIPKTKDNVGPRINLTFRRFFK